MFAIPLSSVLPCSAVGLHPHSVGADAERSCSRRRSVTDAACPLRVLIGLRFAPPFPFLLQKRKRCRPPKEKRAAQNRKCIPCRHRVRRSQLHSVSAGAAKNPYPQPSSSFPNCDRFTGSQLGHLEFYNAARDLDDGGQKALYEYGLWGRRKVEVRPVNRKTVPAHPSRDGAFIDVYRGRRSTQRRVLYARR